MSNTFNIEEAWQRLTEDGSLSSGFVCVRVAMASPCDVFAAVYKPVNRLALFIEVASDAVPPLLEYPQSTGFLIEPQTTIPGRHGRVRLMLSITDTSHEDIFKVLIKDIINHVEQATSDSEGVQVFVDRCYTWQAFFKKHSSSGLSREHQQGLFAELLTLKEYLLPRIGTTPSILSWKGPLGANQDFELATFALEVKSSSANTQPKIYVSNARQLDRTGISSLVILFWSFDVRNGNQFTLPQLISEIGELVSSDALAARAFSDRLLAAGYLDIQASLYSSISYSARNQYFLLVNDDFPCIDIHGLDPGIGDLKYTIELSACLPFQITESAATELMRQNLG